MFFNNAFFFVFPQEPVENVVSIYSSELFEAEEKDGEVSVISDYVSWYRIVDKNSDLPEKYDWTFFFNRNIALVTVELPNPGYALEVAAVSENGETLELSYTLTEGEGVHPDVLCYEVILVETSKNITKVSASGEKIDNKPIIIPSDNYYFVADFSFKIDEPVLVDSFSALSALTKSVPFALIKYDDIYFKTENLAIIPVVLPCSAYKITVDSITENGNIIEIDYTVSSDGEFDSFDEISKLIFVETSKNITEISVNENFVKFEKEHEMQEFAGYSYFICEDYNFDYITYGAAVFHNAESLNSKLTAYASGFSKYDEEYFAEKSLAVARGYFSEDGMDFRPADIRQRENRIYNSKGEFLETEQELHISGWEENKNSAYKKGFYYIIVECGKDVEAIEFDVLGLSGGYGVFDNENFLNLRLTDGQSRIIHDYETWVTVADLDYFTYVFEYNINEKFFEEKSMVLTAVVVPNEYSRIKVNSVNQKNALVEVDCTMEANYDSDYTLAYTEIVVVETSKDTSAVKLTVNDDEIVYDRHSIEKFNLTPEDEPVLVSDYKTWASLVKNSSSSLEKYDETYFKNNSLVVIPEIFNNGAIEPEVIKFYKNGENLEIVYGLNAFHDMGISAMIEDAIIFEVNGNIKNISVERKDLKCNCRTYRDYNLMKSEPTVISEYSEWVKQVDVTDEEYSRYDEKYFENKSVVLFTATLPDSGGRAVVKYAYKDGNTLEVGYTAYSLGGFTALTYQAVLVEVDKNITDVNVTVLR